MDTTSELTEFHACEMLQRVCAKITGLRLSPMPVTPSRTFIADGCRMRLTVTTWNINSVRLRIDLVARFIKATRPDVLCLQETKCPDERFPLKRFKRLGYAMSR